jgi:antirestriction protein ArdC
MGFRKSASASPRDHYQDITNQIVEALEAGIIPWRREWDQGACGVPVNLTTGKAYRGINHLVLGLAQAVRFKDDPRWCSYRQAQAKGWQVRKGERGTMIVFYKRIEKRDQADAGDEPNFYQLLKCSTVFHASQIEGIPEYVRSELGAVAWQRPDALDIIMTNSKAVIRTGGAQAFYSPSTDHIQLPPLESFTSAEGFAHVAVHEMGHWAYAKPRLDLSKNGAFGSASYAAEELRVDIAASMVCSAIGIGTDIGNTAAYVQNWLQRLKDDKREIFRAAADAQRIADFILNFHPEYRAHLAASSEEIGGDAGDDQPRRAASELAEAA